MKIVLIDTNIFVLPFKFKIDIFEEIKKNVPDAKFQTLDGVIKEIKKLKQSKAILELIKKKGVKVVKKKGKTDDALLELALEENALLCTNDKELKKRCLKKGVSVMFMRGKSGLNIRE